MAAADVEHGDYHIGQMTAAGEGNVDAAPCFHLQLTFDQLLSLDAEVLLSMLHSELEIIHTYVNTINRSENNTCVSH